MLTEQEARAEIDAVVNGTDPAPPVQPQALALRPLTPQARSLFGSVVSGSGLGPIAIALLKSFILGLIQDLIDQYGDQAAAKIQEVIDKLKAIFGK